MCRRTRRDRAASFVGCVGGVVDRDASVAGKPGQCVVECVFRQLLTLCCGVAVAWIKEVVLLPWAELAAPALADVEDTCRVAEPGEVARELARREGLPPCRKANESDQVLSASARSTQAQISR